MGESKDVAPSTSGVPVRVEVSRSSPSASSAAYDTPSLQPEARQAIDGICACKCGSETGAGSGHG